MIILSVETSCDETSVAITRDGKDVLSNAVLSQIKIHERFGGVVPEVASRAHIESILYMFDEAIQQANIQVSDIDLVAVTKGPGLIGSLLVGINAATSFAYANKIPIIGVNHLLGHIYAAQIEGDMKFPLLTLLVSGGHTELLLVKDHLEIELLGTTLDDAVGEAYDKVARILGLPYPGGPLVDKLAHTGKAIYNLPKPFLKNEPYNFSFSGLKSAVLNLVHNMKQKEVPFLVEDVCASFQEVVTEVLVEKTKNAANLLGVKQIIVAGGVAANKGLRFKMFERLPDFEILIPHIRYCTDQAAMIGIAAYYQYQKDKGTGDYFIKGDSSLNFYRS
ncbi:t(6)A37 threonylcarbamoyladenosine biosynthesis protein [Acholeplasma oculi]|uniref:tRNA N6-adenosine threonylcarbamoyltransferase n=1 Tax=Acholeplasma oculi TaxID=35623 RepID=A0A061AGM2_9MOLU|nr:tRNA (adenosine(37)-N6)-threonylcarbamoyltransferase complex transferase subunit TsaD [Acholeplasma oculi]CDR30112.1 tRNA N6-adenosine threonylcarbamoyltransferase TsaD [Acholeplasma oculi]SKC44717.1 N6-L-threonylcarbamoyladenine synthase [Acholeplasma oculi]SUT88410.1 t(6)A37 threonylcarbamoyladenosine biosynthesis protein [Acholeplasma oculi]